MVPAGFTGARGLASILMVCSAWMTFISPAENVMSRTRLGARAGGYGSSFSFSISVAGSKRKSKRTSSSTSGGTCTVPILPPTIG